MDCNKVKDNHESFEDAYFNIYSVHKYLYLCSLLIPKEKKKVHGVWPYINDPMRLLYFPKNGSTIRVSYK